MRPFLLCALISLPVLASPVDTADDFLRAVEWGDGEALLETLSESLGSTLEARWAEFGEVARTRPEVAQGLLSRVTPFISPADAASMSLASFLSLILPGLGLGGYEASMVEEIHAEMRGSTAQVSMAWPDGRSVEFSMVWEDGSWHISGTPFLESILEDVF